MKGLDSFEIKKEMTLDELAAFMEEKWDKDQYNGFIVGHPTAPDSGIRYVILPVTERYCVIIYPKCGGVLSKKNLIKASCTYTTSGQNKMMERGSRFMPYNSTYSKMQRTKNQRELGKELRGEADEIMHYYMDHLKELLKEAGLA